MTTEKTAKPPAGNGTERRGSWAHKRPQFDAAVRNSSFPPAFSALMEGKEEPAALVGLVSQLPSRNQDRYAAEVLAMKKQFRLLATVEYNERIAQFLDECSQIIPKLPEGLAIQIIEALEHASKNDQYLETVDSSVSRLLENPEDLSPAKRFSLSRLNQDIGKKKAARKKPAEPVSVQSEPAESPVRIPEEPERTPEPITAPEEPEASGKGIFPWVIAGSAVAAIAAAVVLLYPSEKKPADNPAVTQNVPVAAPAVSQKISKKKKQETRAQEEKEPPADIPEPEAAEAPAPEVEEHPKIVAKKIRPQQPTFEEIMAEFRFASNDTEAIEERAGRLAQVITTSRPETASRILETLPTMAHDVLPDAGAANKNSALVIGVLRRIAVGSDDTKASNAIAALGELARREDRAAAALEGLGSETSVVDSPLRLNALTEAMRASQSTQQ